MFRGYRIIDSHSHFAVEDTNSILPFHTGMIDKETEDKLAEFQVEDKGEKSRAQIQWQEAWGFGKAAPTGLNDKELADKWIKELDKYGIEKIVWVTGGGNERLAKIVNYYPDRFIGYAHNNPFEINAPDKLESALKSGLSGYKLLAPLLSDSIASRKLDPVWEVASNYKIPVLIHFGILGAGGGLAGGENMSPLSLEPVASRFPDVKFIIPHLGCGYPKELLHLGWVCENIYVDSSGSNQWMRWMPYELDLKISFQKFYETFGPERIIFGTDSSWFPRGFSVDYLKEQFKIIRFLNWPRSEVELVFGGNITRIFSESEV